MISPRICCSWFFNIIFLCPTKLRFCYIYSAICQSVIMNHTVGCCEDSAECHQNSSTTVVSTTPNWHHEGMGTCNKLDLIFLITLTQNWVKGDSGTSAVAEFIFLGILISFVLLVDLINCIHYFRHEQPRTIKKKRKANKEMEKPVYVPWKRRDAVF